MTINYRLSLWVQLAVVFVTSTIFWYFTHKFLGVGEAWDSKGFGGFYLVLIALAIFFGALFKRNHFIWAWILMFAELPFILLENGISPLILLGLVILFGLSIPAVGAAWIAAKIATWNMRRLG